MSAVSFDKIPDSASALRKSFASGVTKSKQWRKNQLKALQKLCHEGRELLCTGMLNDLHKSHFEGYAMELNLIEHEIQFHLDHLDEWMKPEVVENNLLNIPGWSRIYKDPLGVVLIMSPWNYPVYLMLGPLIGAISGGNCVMLRPGNYTKHTSKAFTELIPKYMDNNCIKIVGQQDRHATASLLKLRWDKIFFTGGTRVGKIVAEAAAKHLTPTVLELGGKSPCIVDKSASLDVAAKRIVWGAFTNCGQTCVRPDYLFVHEDIADTFISKLKKTINEYYGKNPQKTEFFGRLINPSAHGRVAQLINSSQKYVVHGGQVDPDDKYIAPTLLDFSSDLEAFQKAPIMNDEIFGPALPIYRYKDLHEVIDFINKNEKPLALYCFSTNSTVSETILTSTSSGGANVNDVMMHLSNPHLPFGGVGLSGMGSYHGKNSFNTFTHQKAVLWKTNWLDVPARYPPYTDTKKKVMGIATMVIPARPKVLDWLMLVGFGAVGMKLISKL